jgi:hypothetical protein
MAQIDIISKVCSKLTCVRVCVRTCVRACVCACVRVRAGYVFACDNCIYNAFHIKYDIYIQFKKSEDQIIKRICSIKLFLVSDCAKFQENVIGSFAYFFLLT